MAYAQPQVTFNSTQVSALSGSNANNGLNVVLIGPAIQGPDLPVQCSYADVINLFGDPSSPNLLGRTVSCAAYLIKREAEAGGQNPNFIVASIGVTRAQVTVVDTTAVTPAPSFIIQGIGAYAGPNGSRLSIAIASTGTGSSVAITSITVTDTTSGQVVYALNGSSAITSTAQLIQTINAQQPLDQLSSVIQAAYLTGNTTGGLPTTGTYTLGSATATVNIANTGSGTAATAVFVAGARNNAAPFQTDASITAILSALNYLNVDYVWVWDDLVDASASSVTNSLLTFAQSAPANYQFPKVYGGAYPSGAYPTYASLSSTYLAALTNSRFSAMGQPGAFVNINGTIVPINGPMLGAVALGMALTTAPYKVATHKLSQTIVNMMPFVDQATLSTAQLNTLAQAGFLLFEAAPQQAGTAKGFWMRDHLTTAPNQLNGQPNGSIYASVQSTDDAVSSTVATALLALENGTYPTAAAMTQTYALAAITALNQHAVAISGINATASLAANSTTPTTAIAYTIPTPVTQAVVNKSVTVA